MFRFLILNQSFGVESDVEAAITRILPERSPELKSAVRAVVKVVSLSSLYPSPVSNASLRVW